MVLKRQTVWLLTMLSLIIVLSVYYISMDRIQDHQAFVPGEEEEQDGELDLDMELEDGDMTLIELEEVEEVLGDASFFSDLSVNEIFNQIRLQRTDSRGRLREDLMTVFGSTEASAEAQVAAMDRIENLNTMQQNEEMVETLLKAEGYEDALVIAEDNFVRIYVKADELTNEEVIEIMDMAHEHIGTNVEIRVGYQSSNK
ncbi:stage III sporulation protein AH [Evansella vedderi]|uniref:Stage III sporulation protein AH n=1 Tax=Evansella vedderi TaxID=38282 RepID=A0ABT9ZZW6_9BACI|nr:SpoIIIAH-like family protein [Evansella vedderi]MDQ0256256.1 stage III sporulation protein AH [Evansella vedderi]